jgi:hypothetical protein
MEVVQRACRAGGQVGINTIPAGRPFVQSTKMREKSEERPAGTDCLLAYPVLRARDFNGLRRSGF